MLKAYVFMLLIVTSQVFLLKISMAQQSESLHDIHQSSDSQIIPPQALVAASPIDFLQKRISQQREVKDIPDDVVYLNATVALINNTPTIFEQPASNPCSTLVIPKEFSPASNIHPSTLQSALVQQSPVQPALVTEIVTIEPNSVQQFVLVAATNSEASVEQQPTGVAIVTTEPTPTEQIVVEATVASRALITDSMPLQPIPLQVIEVATAMPTETSIAQQPIAQPTETATPVNSIPVDSISIVVEQPVNPSYQTTSLSQASTHLIRTVDNSLAPVQSLPIPRSWEWPERDYEQPSNLPVYGQSMYYDPYVMDGVIKKRTAWQQITHCAECIGYVALLRFGDIDRRVWLQMENGTVEGPYHVVDTAATHDIPRLLRLGWVIDVDWETAQRWGGQPMPKVTVLDALTKRE